MSDLESSVTLGISHLFDLDYNEAQKYVDAFTATKPDLFTGKKATDLDAVLKRYRKPLVDFVQKRIDDKKKVKKISIKKKSLVTKTEPTINFDMSFSELKAIAKAIVPRPKKPIVLKKKKIPILLKPSPVIKKPSIKLKTPPKSLVTKKHKITTDQLKTHYVQYSFIIGYNHKSAPFKKFEEDVQWYIKFKTKTPQEIKALVDAEVASKISTKEKESGIESAWLVPDSLEYKNISEDEIDDDADLKIIKMYKTYKHYTFSGNDLKFDQGNGECVFDYLMATYGTEPRLKNILASREDLLGIMGLKSLNQGVRALDLEKFCRHSSIRIPMYGIDLKHNIFIKTTPSDLKALGLTLNRFPPLIFLLASNHIYPISDPFMRKSITEKAKIEKPSHRSIVQKEKATENAGDKVFDKPIELDTPFDQIMNKKNMIIMMTTGSSLRKLFYYLFDTHHIIPETQARKGAVVEIYIASNNLHIMHNTKYKLIKASCEKLNIPFRNQNTGGIATKFLLDYLGKSHIHSEFNEVTQDIFENMKKTGLRSLSAVESQQVHGRH
jgi:hypothetical protein